MQFIYSRNFQKKFQKLSRGVKRRIKERLVLLAQNEFHPLLKSHALHGKYVHSRSININGDLRLIYRKVDETTVRLDEIGTHSELYE